MLWDTRVDTDTIYSGGELPEVVITYEVKLPPEEDWENLARLVFCEAAYESYLGKRLVAEVVLNRLEHYRVTKPKTTLRQTILRKGQFDGVRNRYFKMPVSSMNDGQLKAYIQCRRAAFDVLTQPRWAPKSVYYFANPVASTDKSWLAKLKNRVYVVEGNHVFYHIKDKA